MTQIYQHKRMLEVNLMLPPSRSGYHKEWDGSLISPHLTTFVESIIMNVGGPYVESAVLVEA